MYYIAINDGFVASNQPGGHAEGCQHTTDLHYAKAFSKFEHADRYAKEHAVRHILWKCYTILSSC